ncbi:hypothetical protein [Pseudoroseicyclus sp. CXY001]|uniref:hypothetical protein n=1 Tax=Pseudoroseicyclus sp. CXY001 TaxID=3242492 RepID=UPI003570DD54
MRRLLLALLLVLPALGSAEDTSDPSDPALGTNLAGISDWSTQLPFIDLMKSARPWIGHLEGQWGGATMADLDAAGFISPEGWPTGLPEGVTGLETFLLTDIPAEARSTAGTYLVTWEGQARISFDGGARDVRMGDGEGRFRFEPGGPPVSLRLSRIDPDDPIRNITVMREDLAPLHALGAVFAPDFVARIGRFRVLRFLDWMMANGSWQQSLADRPKVTDFSYAARGVPVELIVALGNAAGTDIWLTLPHQAEDDYVAGIASYVAETLDPRLKVYAEYSNELWNFSFAQAGWAAERARERWGAEGDAWMQYAGLRAAEVADIWAEAFADDPDRLVRVVAVHSFWPGLEEPLLDAPLAVAEGRAPPVESFDAYAVSGYIGHELGGPEALEEVHRLAESPDGFAEAAATIRAGTLRALTEEIWPYHAEVARARGLRLIAYEGGTHVAGQGEVVADPVATAFFTGFNYSPEMGALYDELLAAWADLGAGPFVHYFDRAMPNQWGSWGAQRAEGDDNPRWQAIAAANARGAPGRPEGTFATGLYLRGGGTLTGTPAADTLLGGPGDDRLAPGGTSGFATDYVVGGDGADVLVLPGQEADWQVEEDPAGLTLTSATFGRIRASGIEELAFGE